MSWNYNYGALSAAIYGGLNGKMVLLDDPGQFVEDGYLALASALWFYMSPASPKPSMHEISTKLYVPNYYDESLGITNDFGATTMVINGGLECGKGGGKESDGAKDRAEFYNAFLTYFGLPTETGTGCADMGSFSTQSSSAYPQTF